MQLAHSIGFMVREPKRKPETLPEFDRHQYEEYRRYLYERELAEQTQIQRHYSRKMTRPPKSSPNVKLIKTI